ncbi:MAG: Bug family tripartite tricarboxylate transporter substrate binding protein [Beijerinckiaceae bacterium]
MTRIIQIIGAVTVAAALALPAAAQDFYKGKKITMIIPSSAGGGYDTYARLLARHMGRHIPGNPDFVPQNMPGAGGKVAAAYIANAAPKDGTVIGETYPQGLTEAAFGRKDLVKYDTRKLTFIGSMNGEPYYCFARADAPVKSFKDLLSKELIVGATGQGSSTAISPALLNNLIQTKFRIITGYKGSSQVVLAAIKGEVQGWCGMGWSSIRGPSKDAIDKGEIRILFQENGEENDRVKQMKLVRATDAAKSAEDRKIMDLIYSQQIFGRPFFAPPGIPVERTKILRAAFDATMKDSQLLAEAKKIGADIRAMSGEELQKIIDDLYAQPQALLDKARAALDPGGAMSKRAGGKK